jgi:hypothetical protein
VQFPLEDYMSTEEQQFRRSHSSLGSFLLAMRSLYSHRPNTGFKGVSETISGKFEARNSSCPVCSASAGLAAVSVVFSKH